MSLPAAPARYFPKPMHSLLGELASTLDTLETRMAAVADNGTNAHELAVVLPVLIQARDVCALTGLNGPHLLLVEMVRVVEAVIEGEFEQPLEANTALMFAAARLPGYIHRLAIGGRDIPLALLPALNDLRAVRGAPLLSDAVMRLPLFRLPPDDLGVSHSDDTLAAAARQVRPHYMRALLSLIRGEGVDDALGQIAGCLKTLREHSHRRSVRMLWLIARGVVDGLRGGALELKPAVKTLLGQMDQCIKLAVEHGERDLVVSLPPELLRSLLFYCAHAGDTSDVLTVVRQRYQLDDLGRLATADDTVATQVNTAPAPGLLFAARDQVQDELDRVRDAVLAFAHSDVDPAETLQPAGLLLERVCETLGVLGLNSARTTLHTSIPMFHGIRNRHTSARALGTLAEVLLQGSRLLDAELDRQSGADDDLDCSQELDIEQSALTRMPREERRRLLSAVLEQLRAALEAFESAVVALRAGGDVSSGIDSAAEVLRDASRALDVVPLRAAHDAFQRLVDLVDRLRTSDFDFAGLDHSSALVEAVAALDLYLRAMAENDLNGRGYLRACFTGLTSLEQELAARQVVEAVPAASAPPAASLAQPDVPPDPPELPQPTEDAAPAVAAHALDRTDDTPRYCNDPALRALFVAEAHERMELLRQHLETRTDASGGVSVDDRARHLVSAAAQQARPAEVNAVACLLEQIGRLFAHYQRSSASASRMEMDLVTRAFASVDLSLDNLSIHEPCDPDALGLFEELSSLASVLGVADDAEDQDAADELRAVFLEEADELLAVAGVALADWQEQPADHTSAQRLMRSLHTLKGSARVAGCVDIADIAHVIESDVTRLAVEPKAFRSEHAMQLQQGLDRIAEVVCNGAATSADSSLVAPAASDLDDAKDDLQTSVVSAGQSVENVESVNESVPSVQPDAVTDNADDMLRVSSQEVGDLAALANDVTLHRLALHDSMFEAQSQIDDMTRTVRRLEELYRGTADGDDGVLPPAVQETLRDFDTISQGVRDHMRMSRAALDAQRQSGASLQDGLLKLRLLSFESLVPRLQRVVRQTAQAFSKQVTLSVVGGDLSLDRGLLARLAGPLEHVVRNAVVHGIESQADRVTAGKDPCGRIVMHAYQQQGSLHVRVADDGRGIDLAGVRSAAQARGVALDASDDALINLILTPGFSTVEAVGDHAGRGVGLDVVNREVRAAGGNLSIQTQPGAGAVFGLRLPQALTIEKAVLLRAGDSRFAVPLNQVVSIEHVPAAVVRDIYLKESGTFGYDGDSFPVHHLGELIGVSAWQPEAASEREALVLLDLGERRMALHVDSVVGQRELPVRNGGKQLQQLRGFSGASVMADGEVVLVLDVAGLLLERAGHEALVDVGDETRVLATAVASTVMVVDDSVTMRRANSQALSKGGYRVLQARNGLDALQQMQDEWVDALVLDLDMPGMDGYQLLERLRADENTQKLPVVVVSSRSEEESRARVKSLGVAHFLEKPCRGRWLLDTVDQLLGATVS